MVAMQHLIFQIKPDVIVETGIAHGGSLIFYSSLLELNAICGGPADAYVVGVDVEIRAHNYEAIQRHPMSKRIKMVEGSSIADDVVASVRRLAAGGQRVMVALDSNHTHDHVLAELRAYSSLVTAGSYCVVFDTVIEDMPVGSFPDRPWDRGNNPKTAIAEFLAEDRTFEVDHSMDHRLLISVAPGGYLKRKR
jgi:cephalosporin hydroxylase